MTTNFIAKVIEEVYYSGRVKTGSRRLDFKDFMILTKLAKADIVSTMYKEDQLQGNGNTLTDFLETYDVDILTDNYKRRYFKLPVDIMNMPDNAGVFSFVPLVDGQPRFCDAYFRTEPGSEWMLCNDDSGIGYFVPLKDRVVLMGGDSCHTKGQVTLMPNTDNANMPDDIGYKVARSVWQQVMGTRNFPVDKQVDDNPNIDDYLKTKLSAAQTS